MFENGLTAFSSDEIEEKQQAPFQVYEGRQEEEDTLNLLSLKKRRLTRKLHCTAVKVVRNGYCTGYRAVRRSVRHSVFYSRTAVYGRTGLYDTGGRADVCTIKEAYRNNETNPELENARQHGAMCMHACLT